MLDEREVSVLEKNLLDLRDMYVKSYKARNIPIRIKSARCKRKVFTVETEKYLFEIALLDTSRY